MAMIPGSVTIDPATGAASGAGCAKECFDLAVATMTFPPTPAGADGKKKVADICNAIAQGIVNHIKTNAVVSTNDTGTVASGIPVATAGGPAAQTGATTSTGAVTATGTGTVA